MDASRQISDLLAEEYGIVFMDFKKDPELTLTCLIESCALDARACHGGLSHNEKMDVDHQFRNKDFQLLVATELYEVSQPACAQCNTAGLYAESRGADTGI